VNSTPTDVFFYGLFMDEELLVAKALKPKNRRLGYLDGLALRIGKRAALVPASGARVYGVVYSLTQTELDQLYSEPSVQAYQAQRVVARLTDGSVIPALSYNLPEPPPPSERNPEYAAKLRVVAGKVGLPAEYVASIE
jgi:Gamma-glutamyl cyclotransferase, AIG2-like